DGTVMDYGGMLYFLWSGRPVPEIQNQHIFISRMSDPWTLEGDAVKLSSPEFLWEINGPVNEAPQILKNKDGDVFMIYSASGCWTDEYALGMLTLQKGGDPMNLAHWTKSTQPVFKKAPAN